MRGWGIVIVCMGLAACGDATIEAGAHATIGPEEPDAALTPEDPPPPPPPDASATKKDAGPGPCLDDIKTRGVGFTKTTARGVVDAVKLSTPINGVLFASGTSTTPMGDPVA